MIIRSVKGLVVIHNYFVIHKYREYRIVMDAKHKCLVFIFFVQFNVLHIPFVWNIRRF